MGLVQHFVIILIFSTQLVLNFPQAELKNCTMCPAGEYQSSCLECRPCPAGTYTTEWNREAKCERCSGDCRQAFNLKVTQNCTKKSDVVCTCKTGFICVEMVPLSENCRYCEKEQKTSKAVFRLTEAAAIFREADKPAPSSTPPGHSSTSPKTCKFPMCGPQPVLAAANDTLSHTDKRTSQLPVIIVCLVVFMGCVAFVIFVILFCLRQPRDQSCLKQAIVLLLCSREGRDASHKSNESTHHFPRESFSAKQQPPSLSAANLGPVHVHNPGTVIFSLLSEFTGRVGPTIEGGKAAERESDREDERDCPVFHPMSSPSTHLSEEERSCETDSIFFPSQEQGKDSHVSKEEAL